MQHYIDYAPHSKYVSPQGLLNGILADELICNWPNTETKNK